MGQNTTQVSANRMSLKRCFMVVKNLLDIDESEFKNPNSPYNGKYFLHDPMFITLTLKTHNPTVISQIVNIYNDIFTSERQARLKKITVIILVINQSGNTRDVLVLLVVQLVINMLFIILFLMVTRLGRI